MQQELVKRYKDPQICFFFLKKKSLQIDDVQDFDVRWDQALLSANETLTDAVLEGLYKAKLQDSVQHQTVWALYGQETVRNNGQTSYSIFKTSVKLYIHQKIRTRNFRVGNEVIDRGAVIWSRKSNKANVERKVGNCWQWKATGQGSKGDSCSFSHYVPATGNSGELKDEKDDRPLPHTNSKVNIDGKGK